ncbi:MAG: class I SAM-dependent RNA methyltransferase [Pyrinomonadaceae bacterium]
MKSKTFSHIKRKQRGKQEFLEVVIEKIVPNGFGLAFADNLTVFVALAARGDKLRVSIKEKKGKIAFAEIVEILEPSADRVEPKCVYFGRCGGCDFQQLDYKAQLEAKAGIIRDCLTRIGKINYEKEIAVIGSPKPYGYRSRAQWHVDSRRKKLGYFKRGSHEIIDVETCPILTPELQKTLTDLREDIDWESFWSNIAEIEAANAGASVSVYSSEIVEPTPEISFSASGEKYFYDAQSFFQGNPFLIEQLIESAIAGAGGEIALDLYCGVGLFTLPLARKFQKVTGVEAGERAVELAKRNVENARLENVGIFAENVSDWLTENADDLQEIDFILLDPPRVGTEKETIENILRIKPKEISYVSCEPSTLARDLRILCESLYRIESITAIDLFPQTHHIETIVRLKLSQTF